MRSFVLAVAVVLGLLSIAGPAAARGTRAADSIIVSNVSPTPVKSSLVLDPAKRYRIVASGTVSDWCAAKGCPPVKKAGDGPQPNVGVDPLYCYAKWRCATPELWRQLQVNGIGLDELAGQAGKIPYAAGHTYTVEFTGVSGTLSFNAFDAVNSAADNSGSFKVQLTEAGAAATPTTGPGGRLTAEQVEKAVRSSTEYSTFLGLGDPKDPSWARTTAKRCLDLKAAVADFPGAKAAGHIPGETTAGVHSSMLYYPGNDLFKLLSGNDPPAELFKGNVYARATPYYEKLVRESIVASSGNLQPGDVMQMALKATNGNYGLAVLVAHNLLKNVTKSGRETLGELADPNNWNRAEKRQKLLDKMDGFNEVVAKLASLRSNPAGESPDKMGPWYHTYAVLTAGALQIPAAAPGVVTAEHGAKALKQFGGEGGFNKEKAVIDACVAGMALSATIVSVSRWTGSRSD